MSQKQGLYRRCGKRLIDIGASAAALLLLSPLLAAVLAAALICNRGRAFFIQERPGRHGQSFRIWKLKTMRDLFDAEGRPLPDEARLTRFGRFIRKFSLDELLQLANVLKGEMSLIGPRPLLLQYLPLYSANDRRRHEVRPGISGLAQVKGRNGLSWRRRFRYDVFYVDHLSLGFDLMIVWWTIKKVIKADDITADGVPSTELFFMGPHDPSYRAVPGRRGRAASRKARS